jgi:hypothetical protein
MNELPKNNTGKGINEGACCMITDDSCMTIHTQGHNLMTSSLISRSYCYWRPCNPVTYDNLITKIETIAVPLTTSLLSLANGCKYLGYALKNLFIGSEGTLGVITKVCIKLSPKPRSRQVLLCKVCGIDENKSQGLIVSTHEPLLSPSTPFECRTCGVFFVI